MTGEMAVILRYYGSFGDQLRQVVEGKPLLSATKM